MSKEAIQEKNISIRFKSYNPSFISINVLPPSSEFINELSKQNNNIAYMYNIDINNDARIEIDTFFLMIRFTLIGTIVSSNKSETLAEIGINHQFEIEDLKSHVIGTDEKTQRPLLNTAFLANLLGIAISTSRGMIKVKLEGTYIFNQLIPIVNPMDFIKI